MKPEGYYDRGIDAWVVSILERLSEGERDAVEEALGFLEQDPYFFRSGYARERVARRLASTALTLQQAQRARTLVVQAVDGHIHCPQPGIGKLARAVADNSLRRELRARVRHPERAVARRALRMIVNVRHPGLTADEIATARRLVLADAAGGEWLSPAVARLAVYLWSADWEAALRALLPQHGPDRAAAKRLLSAVKRQPDP